MGHAAVTTLILKICDVNIKFLQLALIHQHRVLLGITQPIMKMQQVFQDSY